MSFRLSRLVSAMLLVSGVSAIASAEPSKRETALRRYLDADFPCRITRMEVDGEVIAIRGTAPPGTKDLFAAECPIYADAFDARYLGKTFPLTVDEAGNFQGEVREEEYSPFIAPPFGAPERRLLRWVVVRHDGAKLTPLSHAHYPDSYKSDSPPKEAPLRNRKGLGALDLDRPLDDIADLAVGAVTVNIVLNSLFLPEKQEPREGAFILDDGYPWKLNRGYLDQLDATLKFAAEKKLVVSAIVLVRRASRRRPDPWSSVAAHPEAHRDAFYAMPNVNDAEGLDAYALALDLLARRYSNDDPGSPRIHHWIVHNEVDQGWTWTNAGEKSAIEYFDLYHKSLRLTHLVARQYDPHARAFISLTHHWTVASDEKSYTSKQMLDLLRDFCRAEGDFDWAVAHHPYPEDLRDPRVWEDENVDFTLETPKITFKNIEVLDAWARRPENLFDGRPRTIHLSEQGFNSPDYSEKSLADQAAALAYAWKKIEPLDSIKVFHYHNWVDNRGEFDLRIGLRKFPDDADDPLGKKPIWRVFQAAGSPEQDAAFTFALPIVGVKRWEDARYMQPVK